MAEHINKLTDGLPKILFVDGKLYELDTVPLAPNCFAFKVFDAVLQTYIHFIIYQSKEDWEVMIMDDKFCIDVQYNKYQYDKDTNCFYAKEVN